MHIIIFSFNRAMQLDALLESLFKYWEAPIFKISILYNTSSTSFENGYELIKKKYSTSNVVFVREDKKKKSIIPLLFSYYKNALRFYKFPKLRNNQSSFKEDLEQLIELDKNQFVMFLTDDAILFRPTTIPSNIKEKIINNPKIYSFSIRHDANFEGSCQALASPNGILEWDYYHINSKKDWAYPFSVDGHIYSKRIILPILKKLAYSNPNTLEGFVCGYVKSKKLFGKGLSFQNNRLLSFPINMVQNTVANESLNINPELLNDYYLKGYGLKYEVPIEILTFQQYPDKITLIHPEQECIIIHTK